MRGENWINLNGTWEFEMDQGRSGRSRQRQFATKLNGMITVPFAPESDLSGIGHKDFISAVWYRRTLEIPQEWAGQRVLLHVGACDYESWIYLDGQEVGHHVGGYVSFTVDLTAALQGRNTANLVIYAEDDVRSGAQAKGKQSHLYESSGWDYTRTTGIWQTVWLEAVPMTYVGNTRITPQLHGGGAMVEVRLNGHAAPKGSRVRLQAFSGHKEAREESVALMEFPVGAQGGSTFLPLSRVRAWSPQDPHLYDLEVTLLDGEGRMIDQATTYFGMRSIEINGMAIELNGKPLFQRLILDQGFYPDGIYTAPSEDALKNDILLSQAMGFNGARLHQKVFEPLFLYWCDRLGYMAWGETPDWGLDVTRAEGLAAFIHNWVEQLERDYSHPAIVGWIPFNEHDHRSNTEAFRAAYKLTRAYDASRPCIDASGWFHVETQVYDVHDYLQDPVKFKERYAPLETGVGEVYEDLDIIPGNGRYTPGQPYMVSEFGGIKWDPDEVNTVGWGYGQNPTSIGEFQDRFQGLVEVLLKHPNMCGFCYTQLTDVEQEVNGLYTYDRRPKFDPEWVRSIVSQPAAIEGPSQVIPLPIPGAAEEEVAA